MAFSLLWISGVSRTLPGHFFQEFGGARSIMQFRIDVVVRPSPESAGRVENPFIEFQSATIRRPNPKWRYPVEA